nr:amidohydrolase family protein [Mesorhizobium sp. WSM4875]
MADLEQSEPVPPLPSGSCDCHVHVFGERGRFPMSPARSYTPPPATSEQLAAHQRALGLDRVVVVQPSIYGTDNSCMLDAVAQFGPNARGIAVVDRDITAEDIWLLDTSGIRGIRLNLAAGAIGDLGRIRSDLKFAGDLVSERGWHIQIFAELSLIGILARDLDDLPCDVVIDHFGRADPSSGARQEGFEVLTDLLARSRVYVKLSAPYLISKDPDQSDVASLVDALVETNPDRLLWASNWPHPGGGTGSRSGLDAITPPRSIDDGAALTRLANWVPDVGIRERILVTNPRRLYGF